MSNLFTSEKHEILSPEWVVNLPAARYAAQLLVVAGLTMDSTDAMVSMHEKTADGRWKQILSTPALIGRDGMCVAQEHSEGCVKTPIGTYHFTRAFGIAEDPGCAIPYTQVDDNAYWSGDFRAGMHYNELVDIREFPDLDMKYSEHITQCGHAYRYCLNISFNEEGTPGRGSAIFLHCTSPRGTYTEGCVAIPENIMKQVLQNVREDCTVVIDTLRNLGAIFHIE